VKRNLYIGGHRRSVPEAGIQRAGATPSRPAPRQQRAGPQRREPYATAEERSPGASFSHSPDRSRHNGRFLNEDELRIEAQRRQKAELKRLREEVLDIARELKDMQRLETGRSGATGFAGKPDRAKTAREFGVRTKPPGMSRSSKFAADIQQKTRSPFTAYDAPGEPAQPRRAPAAESRSRPPELRPQAPGGHRHQPVDAAQRNLRAGSVDAKTKAAPARAKTPPPLIVPGVRVAAKIPASRSKGFRLSLVAKVALLAVLMLAGTGLITMELWGEMPWLSPARQKVADVLAHVSWPAAKDAQQAPSNAAATVRQTPAATPFAAPDTYGVYAVSDGQLTPLEPLPIRVPDARVSISSTISKPAPAPLANGRLSFVVYYRELATSVPETASVRIVAKVMQATTFVGGKPKSMAVEDTWAVRGGAVDLRIAPVPTNNEMILIRPADPNFTLSPGRYVLMFKNQAYDFSVAGTVSDTAQCLERADLQDRSVYSECRELPAQPVSF
jgi:hypothetical protein